MVMLKSILVHADMSGGPTPRLDSALALARQHGGHVTILFNLPMQRFIATDPFGGAFVATEALASAQADLLVSQQKLADQLANEDVPWNIVTSEGDLAASLAASAALADLVVVGLPPTRSDKFDANPMLAGDVVLAARVPVLALPDTQAMLDMEGPAVVAWNGSAEAATAVRQAVPLLHGRAVTLLRVGGNDGQFPDTDALSYLSRHGIHAEERIEARGIETVEEVIERVVGAMGAALLVMGAFGHSRLRQTLFGGVTRYMLDSGRVPLLLGH
jgi:nucleotide-binding universal stress UspA family protein